MKHNYDFYKHIPDSVKTPKMAKFFIDKCKKNTNSYSLRSLSGYIKDKPDLTWYLIKTKPHLLAEGIICWDAGDDVWKYICENCTSREIEKCIFHMLTSKIFRETLAHPLVVRFPEMIEKFRWEVTITEEMSVCAMEADPHKYFCYCVKTPKILKMACNASVCIFAMSFRTDKTNKKMASMLLYDDELLEMSLPYWSDITKYMLKDFKSCARLIGSARDDQIHMIDDRILNKLGDWLLHWSFKTAIFSKSGPRPLWRQNVAALGKIDAFDFQACELVLSFVESQENTPFSKDTLVKLICLPDNSFVSKYKDVPIRYSEKTGCLVIDYPNGGRRLDSVVSFFLYNKHNLKLQLINKIYKSF